MGVGSTDLTVADLGGGACTSHDFESDASDLAEGKMPPWSSADVCDEKTEFCKHRG